MGTVGEMVEVALAKRFEEDMEQTYCDIPELRSARNVMRNLGIWDAEVLEGEATTRWVGWPIDDRRKMGHEQVLSFRGKRPFKRLGFEAGDTCRVIVLKGE